MDAGTYSLYIVRCADGTYYTGIALDVEERLRAHGGSRGAKYLRGRRPVELVYAASVGSRAAAARAEYRIKRLDRPGKEALIAGRRSLRELLDD